MSNDINSLRRILRDCRSIAVVGGKPAAKIEDLE